MTAMTSPEIISRINEIGGAARRRLGNERDPRPAILDDLIADLARLASDITLEVPYRTSAAGDARARRPGARQRPGTAEQDGRGRPRGWQAPGRSR
jgi:hypothetical protein